MIELMNCKGMFSEFCINDFKKHIEDYHQGFMIVNDELYIPRYKVISLGLDYDEDTEVIVLDDYNKATAKDKLAQLFNDIEGAYSLLLNLCHENYWQGYRDGFEA